MIRRALFAGLCLLASAGGTPAAAEDTLETLAGTYDGHQTEIGAQLELGSDGRFQYYLSYGAVDEMASGTWTVADGGIVLDSDPVKLPAFEPVGSKKGSGSTFDITLDVPDRIPLQFFSAVALFADGTGRREDFETNRLHLTIARGQTITGLVLLFPIYEVASDKIDVPAGTGAVHFRFAPNDLGTVKFDHQLLRRDGDLFLLERYDRTLRFAKAPPEEPDDSDGE